jgi:hypothetical protein
MSTQEKLLTNLFCLLLAQKPYFQAALIGKCKEKRDWLIFGFADLLRDFDDLLCVFDDCRRLKEDYFRVEQSFASPKLVVFGARSPLASLVIQD